ncbi:hypothetical protein OY671_008197, partial [Metschnikowia pulcherrima]
MISNDLGEPSDCNGHAVVPKATIGGAVLAPGDRSAEEVRQNADFALYHAKETGRGGFVRYWPGIDTRIIHRIAAIRDVDAASREARIEAHYQPIVRFDTRRVVAMEALCRSRMANGGTSAAAAFREATSDVHIASELTERMSEIVAQDPALRDRAVIGAIQTSREKGSHIASDDFGIGYASRSYSRSFQFDRIKIGRSFVQNVEGDVDAHSILCAIVSLGHTLRMKVVAEGVETDGQRQ